MYANSFLIAPRCNFAPKFGSIVAPWCGYFTSGRKSKQPSIFKFYQYHLLPNWDCPMESVFSPGFLYLHGYIFQLFCCWHGLTTPGCISNLRRTPKDEGQNCDGGHELTRPSLCLPSRKPDQRPSQSTFLKYTCLLLPLQKATSAWKAGRSWLRWLTDFTKLN